MNYRDAIMLAKYFLKELEAGNIEKVVHFLKVFVALHEEKLKEGKKNE